MSGTDKALETISGMTTENIEKMCKNLTAFSSEKGGSGIIIVVIIAVILCCCLLSSSAGAGFWYWNRDVSKQS